MTNRNPTAGTRIQASMFRPHPLNPRLEFNRLPPPPGDNVRAMVRPPMNRLDSLAESIRDGGGHPFNPILARPLSGEYQIISGHTRFRALTDVLGFKDLEVGLDVVIREMGDDVALRVLVDDNLRRWSYNGGELARALKLLVENLGMSEREVGRQYNVDPTWISRILALNKLPARVAAKVSIGKGHALMRTGEGSPRPRVNSEEGKLTIKHGFELTKLGTNHLKETVAIAVEKQRLTVKETGQVVDMVNSNPTLSVFEAVRAVRVSNANSAVNSLLIEFDEPQIPQALSEAAKAGGMSPEQYAATKVVEGLVNDGYLKPQVLRNSEYRRWYEEQVLADGQGQEMDIRARSS